MDPSPAALLTTGAVAAVAVFAILHTAAVRFLHEVSIHDLRVESHRMRRDYMRRLEALRRGGSLGVELVSAGDSSVAPPGEVGVDIIDEPELAQAA